MSNLKIKIPLKLDFAQLKLQRDPSTGDVSFAWEPIEQLCNYNDLDIAIFRDRHEDNVAGLIVAWYVQHLAGGGARDSVADELIVEAQAEDEHGGGISHPPGRG